MRHRLALKELDHSAPDLPGSLASDPAGPYLQQIELPIDAMGDFGGTVYVRYSALDASPHEEALTCWTDGSEQAVTVLTASGVAPLIELPDEVLTLVAEPGAPSEPQSYVLSGWHVRTDRDLGASAVRGLAERELGLRFARPQRGPRLRRRDRPAHRLRQVRADQRFAARRRPHPQQRGRPRPVPPLAGAVIPPDEGAGGAAQGGAPAQGRRVSPRRPSARGGATTNDGDAGSSGDNSPSPQPPEPQSESTDEGGCACATAPAKSARGWWLAALAALLGRARRRRTLRNRRPSRRGGSRA